MQRHRSIKTCVPTGPSVLNSKVGTRVDNINSGIRRIADKTSGCICAISSCRRTMTGALRILLGRLGNCEVYVLKLEINKLQ